MSFFSCNLVIEKWWSCPAACPLLASSPDAGLCRSLRLSVRGLDCGQWWRTVLQVGKLLLRRRLAAWSTCALWIEHDRPIDPVRPANSKHLYMHTAYQLSLALLNEPYGFKPSGMHPMQCVHVLDQRRCCTLAHGQVFVVALSLSSSPCAYIVNEVDSVAAVLLARHCYPDAQLAGPFGRSVD